MHNVYIYILVMAAVTYLIRAVPLTLIRKEIRNPFLKSFIFYMPYATLAAMTFPAILFSTGNYISSAVGFFTAVVLAYFKKSLLVVASGAVLVSLIVGILI